MCRKIMYCVNLKRGEDYNWVWDEIYGNGICEAEVKSVNESCKFLALDLLKIVSWDDLLNIIIYNPS